jgi:hypothetical protein
MKLEKLSLSYCSISPVVGSVSVLQINKEYKNNLESLPTGRQGYAHYFFNP